jgi:hypothetical protein
VRRAARTYLVTKRTRAARRCSLKILEARFNLHLLLNEYAEVAEQKVPLRKRFSRARALC